MTTTLNFNHRYITMSSCKLVRKENRVKFVFVISSFYTCTNADLKFSSLNSLFNDCTCSSLRVIKSWKTCLKNVIFLNGRFTFFDDQCYFSKDCNLRSFCKLNEVPIFFKLILTFLWFLLKQLYWNCTSAWVFCCKFTAYFHNVFF